MSDRLYNLLPRIHRLRDAERGGHLRALLAVLETEIERVGTDIDTLYDSWFIETCPEWVVPYIGEFVKAPSISSIDGVTVAPRAYVANTIAYRRRKGTGPVLEQVARDVTGWPARVTEYFQRVTTTQHMQHVRATSVGTVDMRTARTVELAGTAFEEATHLVDMHNIDTGRGRYNVPNIGVSLWRLRRFELEGVEAYPHPTAAGCFYLCPLQAAYVLLNKPETETDITHYAEEKNVPGRLRPRALHWELANVASAERHYFSDVSPSIAFAIAPDAASPGVPVDVGTIQIGSLDNAPADWKGPSTDMTLVFDPIRARVHAPSVTGTQRLLVTFGQAAPAELGGGPYDRDDALAELLPTENTAQFAVTRKEVATGSVYGTLAAAIAAWDLVKADHPVALITILDNGLYDLGGGTLTITLPAGARLVIAAAEWPEPRVTGEYSARSVRPWLRNGNLSVVADGGGAFALHGVVLDGQVQVAATTDDGLDTLAISHCTVLATSGAAAVTVGTGHSALGVTLDRSVVNGASFAADVPTVDIEDCILGHYTVGDTELSLSSPDTDATITGCTVTGSVSVRTIEASNCIFRSASVTAARRQEGCVRYSFIDLAAHVPRRYRCQPDLAVDGLADTDVAAAIVAVTPRFRSTDLVNTDVTGVTLYCPDYLRLSTRTSASILSGADDGGEMGVFHHLGDRTRARNLQAAIEDYIRTGCTPGTHYPT